MENEVELVEVLGRVHFYPNEAHVKLRTDYGVLGVSVKPTSEVRR